MELTYEIYRRIYKLSQNGKTVAEIAGALKMKESAVENILSEKYVIRFKTKEGEGVFKMPNSTISMDGYFCVRKS